MNDLKRDPARPPLKLRKESLRLLGSGDLTQVVGGCQGRNRSRFCMDG